MNCNVARDLLAGYNDNVLEEETKKELEKHLADCEKCSKLNENFNAEIKNEKIPDNENIKPFKKVRKKITRRNIITIILTILLLAILGVVGYLTAGQILKKDMYSFELIGEDIVGRKFAKGFISGDIDQMMKYVYLGKKDEYDYSPIDEFKESDIVYEDLKEKFKEAYDKDFSDKKIKIDCIRSYYIQDSKEICIQIYFNINDQPGILELFKVKGNKYNISMSTFLDNYPEFSEFTEQLQWITNPYAYMPSGYSEINSSESKPWDPFYFEYYTGNNYYIDDESSLFEKIDDFQKDGTRINRVLSGRVSYDTDKKTFYKLMCFKITDGKTGKSADYTVKCNIWCLGNEKSGFDSSYEELLNDGVREEKIQEFKEIYNIS